MQYFPTSVKNECRSKTFFSRPVKMSLDSFFYGCRSLKVLTPDVTFILNQNWNSEEPLIQVFIIWIPTSLYFNFESDYGLKPCFVPKLSHSKSNYYFWEVMPLVVQIQLIDNLGIKYHIYLPVFKASREVVDLTERKLCINNVSLCLSVCTLAPII